MQIHAGSRREAALHPPGQLLLQLPAPAQRAVIDRLEPASCGRLRLACKSAQQLVNEATTTLNMLVLRGGGADDLSGVRSRFLNLRELSVYGDDNSSAAEHSAQVDAIAQLTGPQPWPAIQAMHLLHLPDAALALAIDRCPSLNSCYVPCSGSSPRQQAMCALARCPSLANLNFSAGSPSTAGIAALLSMTSLTSLTYGYQLGDSAVLDAAWDMRGMTALQSLNVRRWLQRGDQYDPDDVEEEDEFVEAEHARLVAWDKQVYGTMRLPASLFGLCLDYLPTPTLALPCLVSLTLSRCTAKDEELARLAAGCRCLKQLSVDSLDITAAAHAAPLTELHALEVAAHMDTAAGVRLAGAFPALRSLTLRNESSFDEPEVFFVGASKLEFLAASCGVGSDTIHWSMPVSMFRALASLQQLSTVHLDAEGAHVEGVRMLMQLTSIQWTVHPQNRPEMLDKTQRAFAIFSAPARLRHATILFANNNSLPQQAVKLPLDDIGDAIISWLVQAPALEHVVWERQKYGAGAMTAAWLGALTVSNSIRHISIDFGEATLPPLPLMDMSRMVAVNRQVCVQIKGMDH